MTIREKLVKAMFLLEQKNHEWFSFGDCDRKEMGIADADRMIQIICEQVPEIAAFLARERS